MQEVGFQKSETARLLYAWELYALFRYNAARHMTRARAGHYTTVLLSVLTTAVAVVYSVGQSDSEATPFFLPASVVQVLGVCISLLPLASTFLLTVNQGFLLQCI